MTTNSLVPDFQSLLPKTNCPSDIQNECFQANIKNNFWLGNEQILPQPCGQVLTHSIHNQTAHQLHGLGHQSETKLFESLVFRIHSVHQQYLFLLQVLDKQRIVDLGFYLHIYDDKYVGIVLKHVFLARTLHGPLFDKKHKQKIWMDVDLFEMKETTACVYGQNFSDTDKTWHNMRLNNPMLQIADALQERKKSQSLLKITNKE